MKIAIFAYNRESILRGIPPNGRITCFGEPDLTNVNNGVAQFAQRFD